MSNNLYSNFAPIMNDGRNFTNYIPECQINNNIQVKNQIYSNYDYRQFLIRNAKNLIKTNQLISCDSVGPCLPHVFNKTNNKKLYENFNDKKHPYGYETSDLKKLYLSRMELESRKMS